AHREHVADLCAGGFQESRRARSLVVGTTFRLVWTCGRASQAHILRRVAAIPSALDPRRSAACAIRRRPACSDCRRGPGPRDRGDSGKPGDTSRPSLPTFWPCRVHVSGDRPGSSRVLGKNVQYKQVSFETMLQMVASGGQKPPAEHTARALYGEFEQPT